MTAFLFSLLIDTAIKGAIILAMAWAIVRTMDRRSAAARHMVFTIGVGAVLLLPALSMLLPEWHGLRVQSIASVAGVAVDHEVPSPSAITEQSSPRISSPVQPGVEVIMTPSAVEPERMHRFSIAEWVLAIWLVGAAVVMLPWLFSMVMLQRLSRRGRPFRDPRVIEMFESVCSELGIRRGVVLLESTDQLIPLAFGVIRCRVMMPAEACDRSNQRLRMVLLHELAHLKRLDCATQLAAQIVCAIHWFNPLTWLVSRSMRIERELACDDVVLSHSSDAANYADHLVELARHLRAPAMARVAGVAVVGKSQLFNRVRAILDPDHDRERLTHRRLLLGSIIASCVLLPLAMLRGQDSRPAPIASAPTTAPTVETPLSVLLVSDGNYYLKRAVEAMGLKESKTISPSEYEQAKPENYQIIIFDRHAPRYMPIRGAFIHVGSIPKGLKLKQATNAANQPEVLSDIVVSGWKLEHPILQALSLSKIYVAEALKLEVSAPESEVLISGDKGPLVVLHREDNRFHLVIGFDVLNSNWPLKVSFPIFLYNAVQYMVSKKV